MNKKICYFPLECDKKMSERFIKERTWIVSPDMVATLRAAYDKYMDDPLNLEDIEDTYNKLKEFRVKLLIEQAKSINDIIASRNPNSKLGAKYTQLKETMDPLHIDYRVNMIAIMFSKALQDLQERYPNLTKEELCNGINIDGKIVGGQFNIFYNILRHMYGMENRFREVSNNPNISAEEASQYRTFADKYKQIIDNWDSLVALSRVKLAETEGIALNTRINYSKTLNSDELDQSVKFEFDESEARREHWQENNDEKSSYKSIGEVTRKVISTLDTGLKDDLGNVIYANPALVHRRLSIMLKGSLTSRRMLNKLKRYAESRQKLGIDPSTDIYSQLYNILKSNPEIKTAFFVDLRKGWQSYTITRKEGNITKTIDLNDRRDKSFGNLITKIRLGKSTNTTIFDNNGNLVLSNIAFFKEKVTQLFTEGFDINYKLSCLNDALRAIGYNVSLDTLTELVINENEYTRITNLLNIVRQAGLLKDTSLESSNINELLEYKLKYGTVRDILRQIGNTIDNLNTDYNITTRVSYTDNKGKVNTFDSFITPNFTTNLFDDIQYYVSNKDIEGLRNMIRNRFLISNMYYGGNVNEEINPELIKNTWLKELWNSDLNDTKSFANNISYSRYLGDDTHVFEDFTSKQHLLTIWQYYNSNRDKGNKNYASYPMFILGDSGVAKFITAKRYDNFNIVDALYEVYENELLRWSNTAMLESSGVNIYNLSEHRGIFTLLPFLNNLRISYVENGEIKEGVLDRDAWLDDSINSIKNKIDIEDVVKKAITSYMELEVEKLRNTMLDLDVISVDSEGNYNTDNLNIPNTKLYAYLVDFINNYKFAMIQQLQLFAEDPAFYDNIEDLQKRFKQSHAPGSEIDTDALWEGEDVFTRRNSDGMLVHDTTETAMYLKDIKIPPKEEFLDVVKRSPALGNKIASIYSKGVSLTDGQGWRTLPSYRKIMIGARKWTKQHERAYNKIMAIRSKDSLDENDIKEIAELAIVFQPIKPFLFGKETINIGNSTQLIPVQHKYAEVVLIPELLPDGILKDMANYMEDNDVDVVLATSCVKVGSWGEGTLDTSSGETSIIKTFENAQIHRFDYSDYRIQTNVPEDINSLHLIGTQARKLLLSGINTTDINKIYSYLKDSDGNYVDEVCLRTDGAMTSSNGDAIVSLFNLLNALNIIDSFKVFTNKLMNKEELSEALIQSVIYNNREAKDKLYAYSLTEEGDFLSPLFDPSLEYDVTAAIFSMYKKLVNKQKISGGSLVQASAFGSGLSRTDYTGELSYVVDPRGEDGKTNILYAECEVPFDLSVTNSEGVKIELDYNDWVNPNGTLKMSEDYLTESDPRYYDYLSWKTEDNKVQIPLIEKYYPGILGIIAYRIPTERAYSMINLKIKRFSKKVEGGVIRVPLEGTKIAGFDFDIDKLYLMRKEFKLKALTKEDISKVWKLFYEANPRIKEALKSAKIDDVIAKAKASGGNGTLTSEEFLDIYSNLKSRLFMYWEDAGLEGSYKDAFNYFVSFMYNTFKDDYDYTKSPFNQSRTARNNAMIQLFQGRLSDPETMGARYTPGGFAQHSTESRIERELTFGNLEGIITPDGKVNWEKLEERAKDKDSDPRPNYDPTSVETLIIYNQQNQVAGKLIGIFANHNANHNFSSLMRTFKLKNPIAFGEHCITGLYDFKSPPKGVDTDLNIAECLAASVDAVKDPTLNYLNYNTITADSAALLLRLGYSVRDVGLLLNQPIIKEICEYKFNNSVSLDQAIRKIVSKYEKAGVKESEIPSTAVSSDRLALSIIKQREDFNGAMPDNIFIETQLKAVSVFKDVASKASELSSFVTTFKFTAANSIEPTFGGAYQKIDKATSYMEESLPSYEVEVSTETTTGITPKQEPILSLLKSPEKLIKKIMDNPFAYEDISFECYLETIKYLVEEYYPYSNYAYAGARNIMKNLVSDGSLSSKDIDSIHLGVLSYIISNSTHTNSPFNPKGHHHTDTSKGKIVTNLDYYIEEFPTKLYRFIESKNKQYLLDNYGPLIRSLLFKTDANDNLYISADYFNLHKEDTDNFMFYWEQLLRDTKIQEEFPNLATELFIYSYHRYSFSNSRESLLKLAPTKVKESTLVDPENNIYYFDFLKQIKKNIVSTGNFEDFAKLYIRNNPKNYKFVYRVPNDSKEYFKAVGRTIDINSDEARNRVLMDKIKTDRGTVYRWKPCIIVNGKMYIANCVSSEQFNWTSKDTITYIRTEPLDNRYYDIAKEDSKVDISDDNSGSTRQDSDYTSSPTIDVSSEIADTIKLMIANLSLHGMDISNSDAIISTLKVIHSELKTDILEQLLNEAREELKNGLYHLDSKGKVVKNCR